MVSASREEIQNRICFYSMGVCYCNNNKIVKDISFNNLSSSMEFIS